MIRILCLIRILGFFFKAKISQYRDHNTEALVNIILEDPEMTESPVKRARTNGDASQVN